MTDSKNGLYILMISVHGLIRGTHLELGVNSDTGGQITYVLELTKALAQHQQIAQVDLVTRKIVDPKFSPDYAQEEEKLDDNARIIRVSCGPDRYIRKELLWAHLDHFVDNCLHFLCQQDRLPDLIHTHYADAGYVGQQLSQLLGIPQVHTGHSLGRVKRDRLLAKGLKKETLEKRYNFEQRIQVEENLLSRVSMVITSTRQEIIDQYGLYKTKENCKYCVIQPGTDTTRFDFARRKQIDYRIFEKIDQSLAVPKKPMILAICRPEPHKNILGLISAYAGDSRLKNMANLVIVSGTRDDVTQLEPQQKKVWIDILCLIDKYDLWGKVSIPKYHTHEDLPIFYQCALHRRGVFVNPAFSEPFGLTLIESAASGLPFVATENGGPTDIVANLRAGLLVNPTDSRSIADGLRQILSDKRLWLQFSRRGILGVKKHYNWTAHVNKYVKEISSLLRSERKRWRRHRHFLQQVGGALPLAKRALISDIDGTLIGDRLALKKLLAQLE
ncbi:MAG: glycosyltransferase [Bdellovibrionales bacterium]